MKSKKTSKTPKKSLKHELESNKKIDLPVTILGTVISGTLRSQVLKKILLQRKEMLHIATVNPEFVMEARVNPMFRDCLTRAYTVADGHGIVWAHLILNGVEAPRVERVSGVELGEWIVETAAKKGEKVFLLGGADGVAERAALNLSKIYPQLQITWYNGAKEVRLEKNEEASLTIARINAYEPDYLLVAYGSPWQDIWIEDNRPYLRARVAIGVGGLLDEWAGTVARCPAWLDRLGGKWIWRLITQPWRLPRITRVLHFGFLILIMRLKRVF